MPKMGNQHYERILTDNRQLGPYPMEKLKRVEQPTTRMTPSSKIDSFVPSKVALASRAKPRTDSDRPRLPWAVSRVLARATCSKGAFGKW